VDEKALHSETNKLITTTLKKREEKAARQPGAASDSPPTFHDEHWPGEPPPFPSDADGGFAPPSVQEKRMARGDEFQERDIIRLLVQFGNQQLEKENMSVAEFILGDIEESLGSFDNPLYGKIASECHALLVEGKSFDQHYFLHHEEKEFKDLAVDLLTSPFELSPNWEAMWNYPLQNQQMPELNFDLDMRQALDRFKLRKIQKMCDLNLGRVKAASDSGDTEAMMRFMKIQQKLNETRNEIAKRAGTVVLVK
jgi:DNA primase